MASFELERFGWADESRLEVIGRWSGVRGRRAAATVLSVDVRGRRHRLPAVSAGALTDEPWLATFEWDGDPSDVEAAELEVGRTLLVALPPPRRRRRPSPPSEAAPTEAEPAAAPSAADAVAIGEASAPAAGDRAAPDPTATDPARTDHAAADDASAPDVAAALAAEREQELAGLRLAHGSLRASHEQLEDEIEELRGVRDERDQLGAELERGRARLADEERQRASLTDLVRGLRERVTAADLENAALRTQVELGEAELVAARADAAERVAAERAAVTEVHSRLATAREEAQGTMVAEAEETERLRAELDTTRADAERLLGAERAEVARLREELATRADDTGGQAGESSRQMLERVSRDLDRERATSRHLRRELDALQSDAAEHRRAVSSATANGTLGTDEQPAVRAVRTPEGTRRRVGAARGHAAQRVPPAPRSRAGLWAARIVAVAAVAAVGIMLFILLSALT